MTLAGVTRRIYASDEIQFFSYLRSLWFDRDVSFDNEYRQFHDSGVAGDALFRETFLERTSATGLRLNFGTIGSALLWSPFYAVADLGVRAWAAAGSSRDAADGYSPAYIAAVCVASAIYGWLALVISWMCARRVLGLAGLDVGWPATLAVWAVWLGTPLVFYMYVAPVMSHAPSAFAVACFVFAWLHVRRDWSAGGLVLLGALAALMTMVREQDAFFAIGPAVDLVVWMGATRRWRVLTGLAAGAGSFAVAFLPQALSYLALNGRIGPSQVTSRKMSWSSPHAWDVLASPAHGFLLWTPLAVFALAGLAVLIVRSTGPVRGAGVNLGRRGVAAGEGSRGDSLRTASPLSWKLASFDMAQDKSASFAPEPAKAGSHDYQSKDGVKIADNDRGSLLRLALALVTMVAAQVYVVGAVESWTLAGAFGQRRFVSLTPVLVVGLAVVFATIRGRTWRGAMAAATLLTIWWNLALVVQFGAGLMNRQRLELRHNAYNTFVTVPRLLPDIARRYVFDRGSFYRQAAPAPDGRPR